MGSAAKIIRTSPGFISGPGTRMSDRTIGGSCYAKDYKRIPESLRGEGAAIFRNADPERLSRLPFRRTTYPSYSKNPFPVSLVGTTLFAGLFTNHYGHWLLESISRLWCEEAVAEADRIVFLPFVSTNRNVPCEDPHTLWVAKALGIPANKLQILSRPARCETLLVPRGIIQINHRSFPEAAEFFAKLARFALGEVPTAEHPRDQRIYLSRQKTKNRPWEGEAALEQILTKSGFVSVHPQDLSLPEQIRFFATAKVIVGLGGSGLHNVVFSRPGSVCISIGGDGPFLKNQGICCEIGQTEHRHLEIGDPSHGGEGDVERIASQILKYR